METEYLSVLTLITDVATSTFGVIEGNSPALLNPIVKNISLLTFMSNVPVTTFGNVTQASISLLENF